LIVRIVWTAAGLIAAAIVIVLLVGYALPTKHRAVGEATFKASPEAIFALISNVDGFASWRQGVTSAQLIPSPDGRKRFREVSGDGTITYLVETSEPNRRLITRIDDKSLPYGGTWTYDVSAGGPARTTRRSTEDGEVYNPLFRFVSRFIIGHDGGIKRYLASVASRFPD
jgi:uncharacterized protein YndB with AHSA1/START domain